MKDWSLLLITLIIFNNVSYASFPLSDTLQIKKDVVQTETVEEYHVRMQKLGFDLSICNCESCRANIPVNIPIADDIINRDTSEWHATKWYASWWMITISIGIVIMLILINILFDTWVENYDGFKGNGLG